VFSPGSQTFVLFCSMHLYLFLTEVFWRGFSTAEIGVYVTNEAHSISSHYDEDWVISDLFTGVRFPVQGC